MKITLEFNDIEKFFVELRRFAALMSVAGNFASFDKVPATESELQKPDLPSVQKNEDGTKTVSGSEEQVAKLEKSVEENLKKHSTPKKKAAAEEAMNPPEEPKSESIRDTDVRKMLSKLIRKGFRDEVKELLKEHGAGSFSDLDEKHFAAVMEKGREILAKEGGNE